MSGQGISLTHSGLAIICQHYANTQATEQRISYTPLRNSRVVFYLLIGFGFGVKDLMLGLGMGLRFVLY